MAENRLQISGRTITLRLLAPYLTEIITMNIGNSEHNATVFATLTLSHLPQLPFNLAACHYFWDDFHLRNSFCVADMGENVRNVSIVTLLKYIKDVRECSWCKMGA